MNFKKCISFLLVFLLLASNAGLAFNVHYCGGEIASVKPVLLSAPVKSGCGMDEDKAEGCCKNKVIKSGKEHDSVVKTFSFSIDAPFLPEMVFCPVSTSPIVNVHRPIIAHCCDAHGPPLFKLYSQYIFYA